jgi:hypothetical protein
MNAKVLNITPDIAKVLLSENQMNRPVCLKRVKSYAEMMNNGDWELNGQTIVFAENGRLLDGQHRLNAVIKSGKTIPMLVVRGTDEKTMHTLDRGKGRTLGNALALNGTKNYNMMASVIPLIDAYRQTGNPFTHCYVMSPQQAEKMAQEKAIIDSCAYVSSHNALKKMCIPAVAIFCHYAFSEFDPEKADRFFFALQDGIIAENERAVLMARDFLTSNKSDTLTRRKVTRITTCAVLFKSFRAFCNGHNPKVLRITVGNGELEKDIFKL